MEQKAHFMSLPLEVREMIYRPLLIARFVMVEQNMTSKEYDCNRRNIQDGPDQTYMFETAILATNRMIHEEARDLCRRENDFICLTSRQPSPLVTEIESLELQMIAKGTKARHFWNISMTLTLDSSELSAWQRYRGLGHRDDGDKDASDSGRPSNYIFCYDELPEFCRILLNINDYGNTILENTNLHIDINPALGNGQATEFDSYPAGQARMGKLLNPLRKLHSLGGAQIDGPLSGTYKSDMIASICKERPKSVDVIDNVLLSLEHADKLASESQFREAKSVYKAALSMTGCLPYLDSNHIMDDGPFPGLTHRQVSRNIAVRLQARIAGVYLECGKLRMARIYTDRAMDSRRHYDHRHNRQKNLDVAPWEYVVYAEVLHVAAMISYRHGSLYDAVESLSEAETYAPFNEEQSARYELWHAHAKRLVARQVKKEEAREEQSRKREKRVEAIFHVAANQEKKAQQLLQSGRSHLASSVYQSTLKKLETQKPKYNLRRMAVTKAQYDYNASQTMDAFIFRLQAGLAAAELMSRNYNEVIKFTESALNCDTASHLRIEELYGDYDHSSDESTMNWVGGQRLALVRLHYCRALALHHLGDTVLAVEHMKKALNLDPGDKDVFEQLGMLRRKLMARRRRLERLNSEQNQLRAKQARRKTKQLR